MVTRRILICPLDWGLGHAARCVPIIRALIEKNCTPIIAADNGPLELLKKEFPDAEFIRFPGVSVSYPTDRQSMVWSMLKQTPALLKGISAETKFIEKAVDEYKIDYVISDNRFGAYSHKVPSVYITHQINILTGNKITDALARKQHAYYMKNFNSVWIPDHEGSDSLAGKLSQGNIPSHVKYIGWLSRFSSLENVEKKYDVSFILSGPEPQRTLLEDLILKQTKSFPNHHFLLVRGTSSDKKISAKNITSISLGDSKIIQEIYVSSHKIVCRSGYTSLMEMLSANRSAWLIPTPGQTEQEYLAQNLDGKFGFKSVKQDAFNLGEVLNSTQTFNLPFHENISPSNLLVAIDSLIKNL